MGLILKHGARLHQAGPYWLLPGLPTQLLLQTKSSAVKGRRAAEERGLEMLGAEVWAAS